MPEELIVKHCSATLAGIKTGSIFTCEFADDEDLTSSLGKLNCLLKGRGLRAVPLKFTKGGGHAIIYIYRPNMLGQDISKERASKILNSIGYRTENANVCVAQLMKKIRDSEPNSFPHEIGLFLGYPPEDVQGFIEHKARGYKFCGLWKVYGDVNSAKVKFDTYKKCVEEYYKKWKTAGSIENLIASL